MRTFYTCVYLVYQIAIAIANLTPFISKSQYKLQYSACLGLLTTAFALTAFCLMFFGSLGCNFLKFTNLAGASQTVTRTFGL